MCALTSMNAVSGKNLTSRVLPDEVACWCEPRHRRRASHCHGQSAVLPDDNDMHLGRERPRKPARDRDRGVAEGVAHAPDCSFTAADSRAECDTGGTERRPLTLHRTRRLRRTSLNLSRPAVEWASLRTHLSTACGKGNTAPVSVFPLSTRCSGRKWRNQGDGIKEPEGLRNSARLHRARRRARRTGPDAERKVL